MGSGILGCTRCPEYQRRDTVTGDCRQHTCSGAGEILVRDGDNQGQCQQCDSNSVPDSLRRSCVPCPANQLATNGVCGNQACNSRQFLSPFTNLCETCSDYLCPPTSNSFDTRCYIPVCSSNQVVDRDCGCRTCPQGTEADFSQRNCNRVQTQQACQEWTRRDPFTGVCRSDQCYQGQYLIRNGVDQGKCAQCPFGEQSSQDYRSCVRQQCTGNQAQDQFGQCYECQPGTQPSLDRQNCIAIACGQYTRLQLNGRCEPDVCDEYSINIQYDNFAGGSFDASFNFNDGASFGFNSGNRSQQGYCQRCPSGQRSSEPNLLLAGARTECVRQSCSSNQILGADGQCQTCPLCQSPDFNGQYCVELQCSGRFFLSIRQNSFGSGDFCQCEQCEDFSSPSQDRRSCVSQTCSRSQFLNQNGECQECSGYPRFMASADGRSCVEKTCPESNQYMDINGDCRSCAAFQVVNYDQDGCVEPTCNDRQIVTESGRLEDCPQYTRTVFNAGTQENCRECRADTCTSREYLYLDGRCYACPDFQIPDDRNNGRDRCVAPTCDEYSIITREGLCQACQLGYNPDRDQRVCLELRCGLREKLVTEGQSTSCEACPIKTRAQDENKICAADPCDNDNREFTLDDGTCYQCGAYQVVNKDRNACEIPECSDNEIVTEEGLCEPCGEYKIRTQYAQGFGFQGVPRYECVDCRCNSDFNFGQRDYCLPNGKCATCGDFQRPAALIDGNPNVRGCIEATCPSNTPLVMADGTCRRCEDYYQYDKANNKCVPADECPSPRERLLRDGSCEKCPDYYYVPEDNNRVCQLQICGQGEIVTVEGTCEECPEYEIVLSSGEKAGKACVRPECVNGVLSREGVCTYCSACEELNSTKTACVKPTCNARSVLRRDGQCETCPEYTAPQLGANDDQCGARCEACATTGRKFLRQDGTCEECPEYRRIGDDRRSCSVVPCTGNSRITKDGVCTPCPDYTRVDIERRQCVETECQDNEILTRAGTCERCPKYQRADAAGRKCVQSPCGDSEYYDEKGFCLDCPACTRSTAPRLECTADRCAATQILLNDGRCQSCPRYQRPDPSATDSCGQVCKEVDCDDDQIVLADGTCESCPEWTKPMSGGRVCGPDVCGTRERLLSNGSCEQCPDYTRGGGDQQKQQYTQCLPDQCKRNQVLTTEGTCKFCGPYERADADQRECAIPACGDRTSKLLQDATFEECPAYTRATEDCKQCEPDRCTLRQKLLENGTCEDCPEYERASPNGRACRRPVCEKNQILLVDGTCQDCPPFEKAGPGGLKCLQVTCGQRQRLLPSGECEDCEAYSRAIHDGKACAPNLCTQRERILQDGTCEACPDFKRASANARECASQVCTARQILQIDGRCADCYPYTRADAAGKICVPHNCNDRQKLGPDGSCVDCPAYERAQGTGLTCGPDRCNVRQRVGRDGTCLYCPLYQAVSAKRRACSKPTCKPKVEYISKDGICQPCAFHQMTGPDGTTCVTDPTKKLPDPQVMAPTPVTLQAAPKPEPTCTGAGCDVWTDEQFLTADQATGFYLNQQTGNLAFILGNAVRLSSAVAALGTAVLIALNAL